MSEVEELCDRAGIIHQGRLVAEGAIDELRRESGAATLEEAFFRLITRGGAEVIA
jgi:ABC-type Na+ transport system ATPase subunit NatA